jgi:hypothetical protein
VLDTVGCEAAIEVVWVPICRRGMPGLDMQT